MSTIKDGGPAFPVPMLPGEIWSHELYGSPNGMSLRGWFAGMALSGIMAYQNYQRGDFHTNCDDETIANVTYAYADAMIAAREGKEDK